MTPFERSRLCRLLTRGLRGLAMTAAALALALPAAAAPARTSIKKHPGYVDGAAFVALAGERGKLVEVNLHGRLLNVLAARAVRRHDESLAAILSNLVAVQAVIAGIPERRPEAEEAIRDAVSRLEREGWERFVRVRESKQEIQAYTHLAEDGETVDGLVVLGFGGSDEVLFVNVAGTIDLERIAVLGDRFDLPGLPDVAPPKDDAEGNDAESQSPSGAGTPPTPSTSPTPPAPPAAATTPSHGSPTSSGTIAARE